MPSLRIPYADQPDVPRLFFCNCVRFAICGRSIRKEPWKDARSLRAFSEEVGECARITPGGGKHFGFDPRLSVSSVVAVMPRLVCVYCSSSDEIDAKYFREAERFGRQLVAHDWGLVYGGGNRGVMGVLGRTVREAGGLVVGIIPEFMKARELALDSANELITVGTMRERKQLMEERADGFVTLPGGIGTLEEFTEVMTLRYLNLLHKPVILVNQDGFYDELLRFFDRMTRERFKSPGLHDLFTVVNTVDEVWPHLDEPKPFVADELWREGNRAT